RHVDIRNQQDDLLADVAIEHVQSRLTGEGEIQPIETLAQFAAELLPEQRLDIRLIVDHQNPSRHGRTPAPTFRLGRALRFLAMFPLAGQDRDVSGASDWDAKLSLGPDPTSWCSVRITG